MEKNQGGGGEEEEKKEPFLSLHFFFTHDRRAIPSHILTLHLPW